MSIYLWKSIINSWAVQKSVCHFSFHYFSNYWIKTGSVSNYTWTLNRGEEYFVNSFLSFSLINKKFDKILEIYIWKNEFNQNGKKLPILYKSILIFNKFVCGIYYLYEKLNEKNKIKSTTTTVAKTTYTRKDPFEWIMAFFFVAVALILLIFL